MSSNTSPSRGDNQVAPEAAYPATYIPETPRSPGTREWIVAVLLFLATLLSTTFAGLFYAGGDGDFIRMALLCFSNPLVLLSGLPFSITLLTILLAHEMGHFLACRYYGIRCTPPYFIPVPVSIVGTLGAFIRIKSPFHNRRVLFDVGVAGPLAGYLFVIPALVVGISRSTLIAKGGLEGGISFGEPLIFRLIGNLVLGYTPGKQDMIAHPIAMAAWFGLLVTSLNLFPIWQLDGGHISYAILGMRMQRKLSILGVLALIGISFLSWPPSYIVFGLLLLFLGARVRFYHPPTLMDGVDLGPERVYIGILALLILIASFVPIPITVS